MKTIFKVRQGKLVQHVPVEIVREGNKLKLYTRYNPALISEIKAMKGARWCPDDPQDKYWIIDKCERNHYAISFLEGERAIQYDRNWNSLTFHNDRSLFVHQSDGVRFILSRRRCFLAFEMGLGKTLTTITSLENIQDTEKLFNFWLVAPYGAQQEWRRQLRRWKTKIQFVVMVTYESLHKYMDSLDDKFIPHAVVFDESIKIKNPSAKRSQTANELCRLVRARNGYIILLSGAPAPKNPIDWWHQIECIQPGFIRESDPYKFRNRYANIITVDHGFGEHKEIESWKEDELIKLGKRLAPLVLVKKKKECLDLPDKIYDVVNVFETLPKEDQQELIRMGEFIVQTAKSGVEALEKLRELSDGFLYSVRKADVTGDKSTESDAITGENDRDSSRTEQNTDGEGVCDGTNGKTIREYKKLTIIPKLAVVQDLLDLYHRDNGGPGRFVIYTSFHATIDLLRDFCAKHGWFTVTISGKGWSDKDVLEYFDDENENSNVVIVANPACVHGLTLATTLCFCYYSNSFSVDHRIQSMDRRDRPGMDVEKGTRILDIVNLPTDKYILDKLNQGIDIQEITIQEIVKCLQGNV